MAAGLSNSQSRCSRHPAAESVYLRAHPFDSRWPTSMSPSHAARPVVLVAERSPDVAALLGHMLAVLGYPALMARDGPDAVAKFRAAPFPVRAALLGVHLDRMDGPATFAALRALDPSLPCAFVYGASSFYSLADLTALGAEALLKPFTLEDVTDVLRGLTGGAVGASE
jgi:CheY-like chemotaxis protein